jgi:hypothetical protein
MENSCSIAVFGWDSAFIFSDVIQAPEILLINVDIFIGMMYSNTRGERR